MKTPFLSIISDDLTGLQAMAGEFSRYGFQVGTGISNLPSRAAIERCEVYGFDTSSRPLSQDEASKRVEEAANHLLGLQVHRLFKHNDSLLQGHVGIELRAFASATSRPVVYAPACPNRGRVTINGRHREVDSAGQPINGGVDVDLLELLDKSGGLSARSLSLAELRSGMAASILSGAKDDVIVIDAVCDADLDLLARACNQTDCNAMAGSVGFAAALARSWIGVRQACRPVLIVAGSLQQATRGQTEALRARTDCTSVELHPGGPDRIDTATRAALAALEAGRHCAVLPAQGWGDSSANGAYPTVSPARLACMRRALGELLRELLVLSPVTLAGFVAAGGSTADLALRDVLCVTRFRGIGWLSEGMTMAFAEDGARPGLPIVTKSGGWGGPDALSDALDRLIAWRCSQRATFGDTHSSSYRSVSP